MTRFNSPLEVQVAAEKFAAGLVQRHREKNHDLNPYCTPGARAEFDRAYANAPRRSWETAPEWDFRHQVGRAVARIINQTGELNHDQP